MIACLIGWEVSFLVPPAGRFLGFMPENGSDALIAALVASGFFIMFNSLLADIADDLAVKMRLRSEGVLYAAFGLLDKWGAAIGALMAGLLLTWVAFPARAMPGTVDMRIMDQLVPIAFPMIASCNIVAMFLVARLGMNRAKHEENLAELQRRGQVEP